MPIIEPPIPKLEANKRDAEVLRKNIELFVDGIMDESGKYALGDLLNESFTMPMLDLLFKRMTSKLRSILFSRAKTLELIAIALDPTRTTHTRSLATSFLVVGSAASCLVTCTPNDHRCESFWDAIFGALQREADGAPTTTPTAPTTPTPTDHPDDATTVAELEALIRVEVKDIEQDGARSLQRSFIEQAKTQCTKEEEEEDARSHHGEDDEDDDDDERHSTNSSGPRESNPEPTTPKSARESVLIDDGDDTNTNGKSDTPSVVHVGIFSADTANFSSQILRYFALRGQKGACIWDYLAKRAPLVDLLLANVGHDDTRTLLLHLVYSDHSEAAIASLFESAIIEKMITRLVSFQPPRDAYARDLAENTFLLLREIIHAPYLTTRGVAISAKTIPLDKVTGEGEYVSICGASREMANSSLRKYTSRKVRHIVHLLMQQQQARLEQLFVQMITELTFWSTPVEETVRKRRSSVTKQSEAMASLSLLNVGLPRPTCTTMLTHLFELTETVDFSEEHSKPPSGSSGPSSAAASATTVGIDCLNFMCSTHLVRTGNLLMKKKLRNELQQCQVSVNCMMGLRVTSIRNDEQQDPSDAFTHNQGNQMTITLDEIDSVESSEWHSCGFTVTIKKHHVHASTIPGSDTPGRGTEDITRIEYFAASSDEERDGWLALLRAVINGDLNALEIFCSDDWRSNVREYRRLRECLIQSMERKGHEIMAFLRQVMVLRTRSASGYHLWTVFKFLNSVLSNESKRLDQMFVSARVLDVIIACYETYPNWSLVLAEITKMLIFCFGDFKNKRSRRCPIIGKLLVSEGEDALLLPLLTSTFVGTDGGKKSSFAGTDTLSNLKLLMESIKLCYKEPKSRSQERIQAVLKKDPKWQQLLSAVEEDCVRHPDHAITSLPPSTQPLAHAAATNVSAPTQPAFQEHIINQITRPCYFTAHGFGSSFLLGDGCAFGYMFKEREGGTKWQKVLLVYEYVSYKLWYFYPSEVDEKDHIKWKWVIPVGVRGRYTHGHDESHSSVGHHGLFVSVYDHHSGSGLLLTHHGSSSLSPANTRELHFSVTKLEDRDQWRDVLAKAAKTIQQLSHDYNSMSSQLKKRDKKNVTHCQDPSCRTQFKLFRRPHSCKRCGKWFCGKCSEQRMAIPEVGLMQPVRHCRACFEAAGGVESEVEPSQLFRLSNGRESASSVTSDGASEVDSRSSFSNTELYELAHGMVSPRSLMIMRRRMTRQDSIDSPTNGFQIDEMDREGMARRQFFGEDDDEGDEDREDLLSPYSSPPASPYLHEDVRG